MAQHTLAIRAYLSYKNLAEKHIIPEIGNIKLSRQRVDHLQKLYSDKLNAGLSRRTVQNIHQFLHTVLEYAVKWGMLVKNLSDLSQAPSQEKEPATVLTPSQAKRLLEMVKDTRYFALYLTANPLGLREGELLGLSWSAIDWEKHTLRVEKQLRYIPGQGLLLKASKTKSAYRTLPLPNIIYTVLHQFREESIKTGMIFHTSVKTPYSPRNILRHFHSLLKRMELPAMPFHNLRHTCASFHLAAVPIPGSCRRYWATPPSPSPCPYILTCSRELVKKPPAELTRFWMCSLCSECVACGIFLFKITGKIDVLDSGI